MYNMETNLNKPNGLPKILSEDYIVNLIDERITTHYKSNVIDTVLPWIEEIELKVIELQNNSNSNKPIDTKAIITSCKDKKIDIRVDLVFSEVKKAECLDTSNVINICSLPPRDSKNAIIIMKRVKALYPNEVILDKHKRPGERRKKYYLTVTGYRGFQQ